MFSRLEWSDLWTGLCVETSQMNCGCRYSKDNLRNISCNCTMYFMNGKYINSRTTFRKVNWKAAPSTAPQALIFITRCPSLLSERRKRKLCFSNFDWKDAFLHVVFKLHLRPLRLRNHLFVVIISLSLTGYLTSQHKCFTYINVFSHCTNIRPIFSVWTKKTMQRKVSFRNGTNLRHLPQPSTCN